jgi:hypothetical protein
VTTALTGAAVVVDCFRINASAEPDQIPQLASMC